MKRKAFLKLFVAAGTLLSASLVSESKSVGLSNKGIKVDAGKDRFGKSISLLQGDTFFCKVSTQDTGGALYIFESVRDKKGGPPLHYHYEQDEWWYILEGRFLFKVGDKTFTAGPGDSIFGPRMVPHAFAKINRGKARLLMAFQPAGKMEEHFIALSEGIYERLSEEEKHKFRQDNGFEVTGPALTYEK